MARIDFWGPTYLGRSTNINASRRVNFYVEQYGQDSKSVRALIGTPGLNLIQTIGTGPIRGMCFFNNLIYFVSGAFLYSLNAAGTFSAALLTLSTSTGRVWMSNNGLSPTGGNQLVIVDGLYLYYWNVQSSSGASVTSWPAQIVAPQTVIYLGGYFIVSGSSGSFQSSALYDGSTWNALDVAAKANSPDPLISVFNYNGQLCLHGSYTTEIWAQVAGTHPPFTWIQGAIIDVGSAAVNSPAKGAGTIFWLANRRNGEAGEFIGAVMAQGYNAVVISPPSFVYQWKQYSSISDAWGYCYAAEGHEFYVITFPAGNATWCYDVTTQQWHERSSYSNSPYQTGRHWGNAYTSAWSGLHYVGDFQNGNIYVMDSQYYTDNGSPIVSFTTGDYIYDSKDLKGGIVKKLQIDAETGGAGGSPTLSPNVILQWSNDSGYTWSSDYLASMGKLGQYKTRLIWRRLGYARSKIPRLTISDPIKKVLIDSYIEAASEK
jgi:hypothetical protein